MTRQQRKSKSQWINRLKRAGYTYRNGKVWQKWRWKFRIPTLKEAFDEFLPIFHSDYELAINEGKWDGSESILRRGLLWP